MISRVFIKIFPAAAALTIVITNTFLFVTQHLSAELWWDYISVVNAVIALLATVTMFYTALLCSKQQQLKRTYWGLTLAFLLYFAAETVWAFFEVVINEDPAYPSIADVFWIIGTIVLISELMLYAYSTEMEISLLKLIIFYIIISAIIVFLVKIAFWQVAVAGFSEDYRPLQKAVDLFYFTGDCLIIYAIGLIIIRRLNVKGWQDDLAWILLLIGMVAMVAGDVFYTYTKLQGNTDPYLIEDLLYSFQYLFWVLGTALFPMTPFSRKKRKRKRR